jgi:hypothetical protein
MNPGYLRVFDYAKEQLICGGKSYYGGLLCCAWRWDMFGFGPGQFSKDWHFGVVSHFLTLKLVKQWNLSKLSFTLLFYFLK